MKATRRVTLSAGFTIAELSLVMVVIGILGTLLIVSYGNYLQRTRDNVRKSDVQQIAAAVKNYSLWNNTFVEGTSCGNNGNGFISATQSDIAGYATTSIASCLQTSGALKSGDGVDPSGCRYNSGGTCGSNPVKAYMKATCTTSGVKKTYIFAYLETQGRNDAAVDGVCDAGSVAGFTSVTQKWGTTYGMNYYIDLQ